MVHWVTTTGILKCPTTRLAPFFNLQVLILTSGNTLINGIYAVFKPLLKQCEMLVDRLHAEGLARDVTAKDCQTGDGNQLFLFLPLSIIYQVIFETAKMNTIPTKDISCFQSITQQAINQKLNAVPSLCRPPARDQQESVFVPSLRSRAGPENLVRKGSASCFPV